MALFVLCALLLQYADLAQAANLVAAWNFEAPVGSLDIEDLSGNGRTLTCTRSDERRDYAQMAPGQGLQGTGAIYFPDRSGAVATTPQFKSVSMWIKPPVGCCERVNDFFKATYPDGSVFMKLDFRSSKFRVFFYSPGGKERFTSDDFPVVTESTWLHLAASADEDGITAWVNNTALTYVRTDNTWDKSGVDVNGDLQVEVGSASEHNQFEGYIDDVRIYDGLLTTADLEALIDGHGDFAGFNFPPVVIVGNRQELLMPVTSISLPGSCNDVDGSPTGSWSVVSKPEDGTVVFDAASSPTSTVSFGGGTAAEGVYMLKLMCTDGEKDRENELTIWVDVVATESLIAWWRFEELEGMRTVTDDSGFGHTLTLQRWGNHQHPWAELESGQGLAGSTAVRFLSRSSAGATVAPFRTFSMWVKRDPACCSRIIDWVQATRPDGSIYFKMDIFAEVLGVTAVSFDNSTSVSGHVQGWSAVTTAFWTHIAVSIHNDRMRIYHDGVLVEEEEGDLGTLGKEDLTFQVGTGGPHWQFYGNADEIRLYRGALDNVTIAALAATEPTGGIMAGEMAPVRADAGPTQSIWLPADGAAFTARLAGSCSGEGTPTAMWELTSAPDTGAVNIESPSSMTSTLSFAASAPAGDYLLRLMCTRGDDTWTSDVILAVFEAHESRSGQVVRNMGKTLPLDGIEGSDATPVGLWTFENGATDSGSGGQTLQFTAIRGAGSSHEYVTDAKFGAKALRLNCTDSDCPQLSLGNAEPSNNPWSGMSVSVWFKSPKHEKLAFATKGSFTMPSPSMIEADANVWHHYAVALDENIYKEYLDGRIAAISHLDTVSKARTTDDAADELTFGLRNGHASYGFDGIIDDLAVYNFVLSNEEIYILATQGAANFTTRPADNPYARSDYAPSMIQEYLQDPPLDEDYTGFFQSNPAQDSASQAAYVHPRIFFTPDELPALRGRLRGTNAGRIAMENLRSLVRKEFPYDVLAERNFTYNETALDWVTAQLMILESFRCLIDGDRTNAVRLGQQLDFFADEQLVEIETGIGEEQFQRSAYGNFSTIWDETHTWQHHSHIVVMRTATALMYDFLYPYLTTGTRDKVRLVIAKATQNTWAIGMDAVNAFPGSVSNWIPWVTGDFMWNLMAIEGEDGFDEGVYERVTKTFHRWTTLGISHSSGAPYEGMGKNSLGGSKLMTLAKHGFPQYMAAQGVRKHGTEFVLATMLPNGLFWEDDLWGGSHVRPQYGDMVPLKFAFPDNKQIDYVYRRALRGDPSGYMTTMREYRSLAIGRDRTYVYNNHIAAVIFASDYDGPADIIEHEAEATEGVPLTYFAKDRGLIITRSAWADEDAAWLLFNPRTLKGGHSAAARGLFVFHALGETWAYYPTGHNMQSVNHSVIMVDGVGMSTAPGKLLDFLDTDELTVASCDLRLPYSFATWEENTTNDFLYEPGEYNWMDLPYKQLPHWWRGAEKNGRDPFNEYTGSSQDFLMAFRTVGLVRSGSVPYALIFDDFQKSFSSHSYAWRMQLRPSYTEWDPVAYIGTKVLVDYSNTKGSNGGRDMILTGVETNNRLLVRLLGGSSSASVSLEWHQGHWDPQPVLTFTARTTVARFRVLLWPLAEGASLPSTSWDAGSGTLVIANPDGKAHTLKLEVNDEGKTNITSVLALSKTITSGTPHTTATLSRTVTLSLLGLLCLHLATLVKLQ